MLLFIFNFRNTDERVNKNESCFVALQFLISAVLMLTALVINIQLNKSSEKNPCNRKISNIGHDGPHIG